MNKWLVPALLALGVAAQSRSQSPPAASAQMAGAHSASQRPVGPIPGPGRKEDLGTTNPYANDAASRQAGRRYFVVFNCSGCHGGHAGGGMGPSLRDRDWIYGSGPGDIFASISQGRAHGMPAWGTKLPPDVIWQLVTYVQSLDTPDEADPPQ